MCIASQKSNQKQAQHAAVKKGVGYRYSQQMKQSNTKQSNTNLLLSKVRCVENNAHGDTANGTGDGNGHDPGEDEQADSLPVDGFDGAVAEADADGGAGDAHGC
jgi:hypothetical protein